MFVGKMFVAALIKSAYKIQSSVSTHANTMSAYYNTPHNIKKEIRELDASVSVKISKIGATWKKFG